jgi:hypothetical protein
MQFTATLPKLPLAEARPRTAKGIDIVKNQPVRLTQIGLASRLNAGKSR